MCVCVGFLNVGFWSGRTWNWDIKQKKKVKMDWTIPETRAVFDLIDMISLGIVRASCARVCDLFARITFCFAKRPVRIAQGDGTKPRTEISLRSDECRFRFCAK